MLRLNRYFSKSKIQLMSLAMVLIFSLILNSCSGSSSTQSPEKTDVVSSPLLMATMTNKPTDLPYTVDILIPTNLFSGPGNTDYEILSSLQVGAKVVPIATYKDFVEVETLDSNNAKTGFVHRDSLDKISIALNELDTSDVPWGPIYNLGCFSGKDSNTTDTLTIENNTGEYHGQDTFPFYLDTPFRVKLKINNQSQNVFFMIQPPIDSYLVSNRGWFDNFGLSIWTNNNYFGIAIHESGASDWTSIFEEHYSLAPFTLVFNDPQGKSITIIDKNNHEIKTIDITKIEGFNLPDGLFPEKKIGFGFMLNPSTKMEISDFAVEKYPSGLWQNVVEHNDIGGLRELA